jgi:general secretion pathway protein D
VLRALQSVGSGKALSLPKVLVANNFRTQFNSVVQEPFGVSFTPGNSSSTNVTFGGTLDAGTTLSIKPQLSTRDAANRFIVLDYSISISSFGEQGRGDNLPPSRQVNTVQSLATLPDGSAVVVGGLESIASSQSADQVPLIGDIPLIGEVFKNRSSTASQSRFFVLIRATSVNTVDQPGVMQTLTDAATSAASPQWSPATSPPSSPQPTTPAKPAPSGRDWTRTIGISP